MWSEGFDRVSFVAFGRGVVLLGLLGQENSCVRMSDAGMKFANAILFMAGKKLSWASTCHLTVPNFYLTEEYEESSPMILNPSTEGLIFFV